MGTGMGIIGLFQQTYDLLHSFFLQSCFLLFQIEFLGCVFVLYLMAFCFLLYLAFCSYLYSAKTEIVLIKLNFAAKIYDKLLLIE